MNKGFQSFEKMYLHLWTYMKILVPVLMDSRIFREIAVDNPQELIMNRGLGYGIV